MRLKIFMMQFLKSILFGSEDTLHKINKIREETFLLTARVTLLEAEMKKTFKTTTEISNCLQSFSGIVSDLAADMSAVSLWMQTQAIKELKEINEKKHKKDPLSFDGFDDDDETLVN